MLTLEISQYFQSLSFECDRIPYFRRFLLVPDYDRFKIFCYISHFPVQSWLSGHQIWIIQAKIVPQAARIFFRLTPSIYTFPSSWWALDEVSSKRSCSFSQENDVYGQADSVIYIANETLSPQLQGANLRQVCSYDSRALNESHKLKVLINVFKLFSKDENPPENGSANCVSHRNQKSFLHICTRSEWLVPGGEAPDAKTKLGEQMSHLRQAAS